MEALRFGTAIGDAWRLWRQNWRLFAVIAVVVVMPLVAVIATLTRWLYAEGVHPASKVALFIAGVAVVSFGEALCAGLAEHVLRGDQVGQPRRPLRDQVRALPLGTLAVLALIVGGAVAIGLALSIIPGLVIFAWLAVSSPAASFERLKAGAALRASVNLVRRRFWPVARLTSATFVPAVVAEAIAAFVHARHPPYWLVVSIEAVVEAAVVSLTAAVVVVVYAALRATPLNE